MRVARRGLIVGVSLGLALLASCTSFGSDDGLTAPGVDAGSEGAIPYDAALDASNRDAPGEPETGVIGDAGAGSFCPHPDPLGAPSVFCSDFDTATPFSTWTAVNGVVVDHTIVESPSASALVLVSSVSDDAVTKEFTSGFPTASGFTLVFSVNLGVPMSAGSFALMDLTVGGKSASLQLKSGGWIMDLFGLSQTVHLASGWNDIVLVADNSAGFTVTIGKTSYSAPPLATPLTFGTAQLKLGMRPMGTISDNPQIRFDNVAIFAH